MNLVPFRSPDMTTRLDYNKTMTSLLTILASSAEIGVWEPDLLVRRQSDLNLKLLWKPELNNSEIITNIFLSLPDHISQVLAIRNLQDNLKKDKWNCIGK